MDVDIPCLVSLLVELRVSNLQDLCDYSNNFNEKFLMACSKLNCDYETIANFMKTTSDLYFSDNTSPEWKYVILNLFILKRIQQLNEKSSEMLSVRNNKILRNSVEHLSKIGIYSKLQPKLPGYISKPYIKTHDIFYSYNILKCTSFTLCKLIDCSTLRVAILSEGLRALLVALYQIAYCPLKMSNLFSQDVYKKLLAEKGLALGFLKNLQEKIHSSLFVKETMALVQPNTPLWFKTAVFHTLNDIIVSQTGVEVISTTMLDGAINDKTQTWKAIDIIAKLIISSKENSNICDQVFKLLDKTDENSLVYEIIFLTCVKEINIKDQNLENNIFLKKIFDDLRCFTNKDYRFQNEDVTNKVKQILRLVNTIFVEKGVENPNLPINVLVQYLEVIFKFYCITLNQGMPMVNKEAKEIILKAVNSSKDIFVYIFDGIWFDICTKTLPFRNNISIELKEQKILVTNREYSVTYSVSEKSEFIMRLIETEPDILFEFFGYLLNCIADKDKYFKDVNREILSSQEELIHNRFERKLIVYKLLAELSENKHIQDKIVKTPQDIIRFFQNILKNSIEEKEHKLENCENEKFQSLFTIVMILQALISLGTTNQYNDYQEIISELKVIQRDTPHLELAELVKNILNIIETKDERSKLADNKEESEFDKVLEELCDPLLPVRGHALISMAKLVEKNHPEVLRRKQYVLTIFQQNLKNQDSFIYLAAINGLVAFANSHTDTVLSTLCDEYSDFSRNDDESLETKMKLGEVLVRVTKMLGDMALKHKAVLINTFLSSTKDDDYLVRASSMSNLGEVCRVLGYKLGTIVTEILVCVHGIITTDKSVEARRAAVMVLRQLLAGLENDMIDFLKEEILPIYRTLKEIYNSDSDDIMRLQAQLALEELNHNMMNFIFPKPELAM